MSEQEKLLEAFIKKYFEKRARGEHLAALTMHQRMGFSKHGSPQYSWEEWLEKELQKL